MRNLCPVIGAAIALILSACGEQRPAGHGAGDGRLQVFAVNYPTAFFAERLVADDAVVVFPAPTDVDPAYWEPDVDTILAYQLADLILLNGAGYAQWARKVSLPERKTVDTGSAYAMDLIAAAGGPVHSHGPGGAHEHGELASTTWLDLELAGQQVRAIEAAVQELLPERSAVIAERAERLTAQLAQLDRSLMRALEPLDGEPVLFSHPVYQYLQRRYGLNGQSVHLEPDRPLTDAQWREFEDMLQSHPARLMLWEDDPLPGIRERLHSMGVEAIVFRPLGNRPAEGDFVTAMRANIATIVDHLERRGTPDQGGRREAVSQTGYQALLKPGESKGP